MSQIRYSISDLAREFGISARTIRFYEEKGFISPAREGNQRVYSAADRVRIKLILRGKRIGMTLDEAVSFIDMYHPGENNTQQLLSLLDDVRERRIRLEQQQKDIEAMLAGLDEVQTLCEQALEKKQAAG